MLFADLKTSLQKSTAPAYLLFGSDCFLVNKAVELITETVSPTDITKLDEGAQSGETTAACRTVSFFGGKKIVLVRNPSDQTEITKYLASPDKDCVLIVICEGSLKLKNIESVDCNPMVQDLAVKLIAKQISLSEKKITAVAANLLAQCCGNNYARINNEINKLINYFACKETITPDEINEIVTKIEEYQIYEFGNSVMKRDFAAANKILENLRACGADEYAIFASLVLLLRRIYYGFNSTAAAERLGVFFNIHPYAITAARRDFARLANVAADLYKQALDLEYQIKSGKISVSNAIALLQMTVCV